jgi:hypothetical protein
MAENLILQILRESEGSVMTLEHLLDELHARNFTNDEEAKASIWRLISEAQVELTPAYEVKAKAA